MFVNMYCIHVRADLSTVRADVSAMNRASAYIRAQDVLDSAFSPIGCNVLTIYGSGVLLGFDRDTRTHRVRLRHTHYAGSAMAYLQKNAFVCCINTSVGMRTHTPYGTGVCTEVRSIKGVYTAVVALPFGTGYMLMSNVSCPSAKVVSYVCLLTYLNAYAGSAHSGIP
jgi:hypothetical protein